MWQASADVPLSSTVKEAIKALTRLTKRSAKTTPFVVPSAVPSSVRARLKDLAAQHPKTFTKPVERLLKQL